MKKQLFFLLILSCLFTNDYAREKKNPDPIKKFRSYSFEIFIDKHDDDKKRRGSQDGEYKDSYVKKLEKQEKLEKLYPEKNSIKLPNPEKSSIKLLIFDGNKVEKKELDNQFRDIPEINSEKYVPGEKYSVEKNSSFLNEDVLNKYKQNKDNSPRSPVKKEEKTNINFICNCNCKCSIF